MSFWSIDFYTLAVDVENGHLTPLRMRRHELTVWRHRYCVWNSAAAANDGIGVIFVTATFAVSVVWTLIVGGVAARWRKWRRCRREARIRQFFRPLKVRCFVSWNENAFDPFPAVVPNDSIYAGSTIASSLRCIYTNFTLHTLLYSVSLLAQLETRL